MDIAPSHESDEPAAKRICTRCVCEPFLKALIGTNGIEAVCSYCEDEAKTFTIEQLADRIEKAFDDHYERTPTEPEGIEASMQADPESDYDWERHGEQVVWAIANAADIKEEPALNVLSVLQDRHSDHESAQMGVECDFDKNSYYEEKNSGYGIFGRKWDEFVNGLKTEARFFSRSAQAILDEIFDDLSILKTNKGSPVVVVAGPNTEINFLHRARVFAAEDEKLEEAIKYPWKHLGPPPMLDATAGRMNARGISVFYGAIESEAAMAEVRPPVGSKVAIAKFTIERPLRLLDVAALKSATIFGSVFDPKYLGKSQRANFMEILSEKISRPVMPNEEAFEYLATQAVADYLATEEKLDGIIFPSVQLGHASSNVVLFHHSSRVAEVQIPKGTKISARIEEYDEDGSHPDYSVVETLKRGASIAKKPDSNRLDLPFTSGSREPSDIRPISLNIDLASVVVHHITAVSFVADKHRVSRHRCERPEMSEQF